MQGCNLMNGDVVVASSSQKITYSDAQHGWRVGNTVYVDSRRAMVVEKQPPSVLSPIEFQLCFTAQERVTGREIAQNDAVVADFLGLLDDPRLSQVDLRLGSVKTAVAHFFGVLVEKGFLAADDKEKRVAAVLRGEIQ